MQTYLHQWKTGKGWLPLPEAAAAESQLVLYFGSRQALQAAPELPAALAHAFPAALLAGCSTSGEITGPSVHDHSVVVIALHFDSTRVRGCLASVGSARDSEAIARSLGLQLLGPDLRHVLVLSDGLLVNGSALAAGFRAVLPPGVHATGGLAGDGADFKTTLVGLGPELASGQVAAIGFYGAKLTVRSGSAGGWEPFGPRRLITKSRGNVLYQLDDQPALALYQRYLAERAANLPASGLIYPLQILATRDSTEGVVRTMLAVDETTQSVTYAGDIPQGAYARLMKASIEGLVDGAIQAAVLATGSERPVPGSLALLVSCVGRKLMLGQRVEEEIEAVQAQLGPDVLTGGFYSYGELCPSHPEGGCELHNQTMTLTVFSESE